MSRPAALMKKRGAARTTVFSSSVVADDVADVLAQEALDALVEFLDPVDVLLHHAVRCRRRSGGLRPKRRDAAWP